jgi:alpha-L-rhamnosidase-like protein
VPSIVLDYGKDMGGRVTFDVAAASVNSMQVSYSETVANIDNDGAFSDALFASGNGLRTESLPVPGPGTVSSPLIQGGQRYVRVALTTPGTITLQGASIIFSPPRDTPDRIAGHFITSDVLLNRIWWAGAYTLNLSQMTPGTPFAGGVNQLHLLLDGAKRDRAVWSGDHLISDLTDYYVSDPVYARDSLSLLLEHPATLPWQFLPASGNLAEPGPLPGACSPNPNLPGKGCITWSASYSMAVIPALYNYFLYTGDRDFPARHWQAVIRQMEWDAQHVGPDGLFVVDSSDNASWNLENVSGRLTYVNAMYSLALQSASKLARALGDRVHAAAWANRAEAVNEAVNSHLWDQKLGVYDGSAEQRGSIVQDGNVTAILAGIPNAGRTRTILRVLRAGLASAFGPLTVSNPKPPGYIQLVSPYMGGFHVLADFASGDGNAALDLIRQEWGYMVTHDPTGVVWERIQLDGRPAPGVLADSMAHAWSTGPTAAMSQYILGVTPASAGFRHWSIAPRPADLRWAQGVVPTPRGPISVRWRRNKRKRLILTVRVPRRSSGTIAIPFGRGGAIARNGRIVWSGGKPRNHARAKVVGGSVIFEETGSRATYAWVKGSKKRPHGKRRRKQ